MNNSGIFEGQQGISSPKRLHKYWVSRLTKTLNINFFCAKKNRGSFNFLQEKWQQKINVLEDTIYRISGIHKIQPDRTSSPIFVHCFGDLEGGWTV